MRDPWSIRIMRHAVLLLFTAIAIFPVLEVVSVSLRPGNQLRTSEWRLIPEEASLTSFETLWADRPFLIWLRNSMVVAGSVTATGVSLAAIGGYALSRYRFVGKNSLMLSLLTTQMFPPTMLLLPLYLMIAKLHLINTFLGLILIYLATALPFCLWQMKGFYDTISPSLEEAASIDGCPAWGTFWRIILPLALPGLVITALFSFMTAWAEYLVAAQVLQDGSMFTLPLGLKSFQASMSTEWGLYAAGSLLVSVPVVCLFVILSKYLVNGLTLGSVKE
jgi:arabinogalactan oligomer / maltooligosaccharide transport system permease protein